MVGCSISTPSHQDGMSQSRQGNSQGVQENLPQIAKVADPAIFERQDGISMVAKVRQEMDQKTGKLEEKIFAQATCTEQEF